MIELAFSSDLRRTNGLNWAKILSTAQADVEPLILRTRDIWCRDFCPVQTGRDRVVWFRYEPDYLKGQDRYRTRREEVEPQLPLKGMFIHDSMLVADGGNLVGHLPSRRWIATEKVLPENPGVPSVHATLAEDLEAEDLRLIPVEPGDILGHADGVARFLDERTVLVSDYRAVDPDYGAAVARALKGYNLVPFPYCPEVAVGPDGIPSAVGCYLNFLEVGESLFVPQFELPEDEAALRRLADLKPRSRIIPVPCRPLARRGGVLNCIAWTLDRQN